MRSSADRGPSMDHLPQFCDLIIGKRITADLPPGCLPRRIGISKRQVECVMRQQLITGAERVTSVT